MTQAASSAGASASTAAAAGTGIAAKAAALTVTQKVVAGVAAASIIGGSAAGVATVVKNSSPSPETTTYVEEVTTAPSQTTHFVFAEITTDGTTESTTAAPATVSVEIIDMNGDVADTLVLTVPAETEMTWEYLVALIKENGYEPKAGIYGDAVDAVAESGKTYTITAEL